jgi:hypothetical protein
MSRKPRTYQCLLIREIIRDSAASKRTIEINSSNIETKWLSTHALQPIHTLFYQRDVLMLWLLDERKDKTTPRGSGA